MMNIILFGFKGVGKTYLGKKMSEALKCPFYDLDEMIHKRYNKSTRELFQERGEDSFRIIEKEMLKELSSVTNSVIALGGGTVLDPDNVMLLQTMGTLYYLRASFETIWARIGKEGTPAFVTRHKSLKQIYEARIPIYEAISAQRINI